MTDYLGRHVHHLGSEPAIWYPINIASRCMYSTLYRIFDAELMFNTCTKFLHVSALRATLHSRAGFDDVIRWLCLHLVAM